MENISVNNLVEEFESNLPREISVSIAKNILNSKISKENAISEYKKNVDLLEKKIQRSVINCTGTLLHTNLGRAQINPEFTGDASNIEYDLDKHNRGKRNEYLTSSMNLLLNSENVCFVNNNAASLFIALKTIKETYEVKSVIISRGELIEIGGSYRLPEIIESSGLKLKEVGTTNKTDVKDYEKALKSNPNSLLLKVHRSNFSIEGFSKEVSIKELKTLSKKYNVELFHDLGSGLVVDRKFLESQQVNIFDNEPTVQESLTDGSDLVMFSGDKLFGSVQAGIIAGREKLVEDIKNNPLFRTYRCSPLILFELQNTVNKYVEKNEIEIPIWSSLLMTYEDILLRIKNISKEIKMNHEIVDSESLIGGGTMPDKKILTPVISISNQNIDNLLTILSNQDTPLIPRVSEDKIIIDVRSCSVKNDKKIIELLSKV